MLRPYMLRTKFWLFVGCFVISFFAVGSHTALALDSDVLITKEGKVTIHGARVVQLAGPTLYTRLYWGDAFIRLLVKGNNTTTKVFRSTGEAASLAEIREGDVLDLEGVLEPGGTALVLLPSVIKNSSDQKKQVVLQGTITAFNMASSTATVSTTKYGVVTVVVGTTTQLIKGTRTVTLPQMKVGDTVKQVTGSLDLASKTMQATALVVYLNPNLFVPKLYILKLTTLTLENNTPVIMEGSNGGVTYKLVTSSKTTFLNKNKEAVSLSRYVVGDTLRIWGALRETDDPIIDTEVVRNMNL